MANVFVPEYLDIDFNSLVASIKEELANNDSFKDYNYEGSNIAILIELVSYIGELNSYYLNMIAKNMFMETTDIYENANRISRQEGYEPKGYVSSKTTLNLTIPSGDGEDILNYSDNDILEIPAWSKIASTKTYDNTVINFATTRRLLLTGNASSELTDDLPVVQGDVVSYEYTGNDIIDNEIILPLQHFATDDDVDDTVNTVELTVNGTKWIRVSDFYDDISLIKAEIVDIDTVYMVQYDRYKRYKIVFSSSRSVPVLSDEISITMLKSLGINGNVAANSIIVPTTQFIKNVTDSTIGPNVDGWLSTSTYSLTNSAASIGGADPEDIDELRENAIRIHSAQYRNVTATDYKAYLESRSDVECAHAWGEQEVAPSGSILEYNKIHLVVVPPNPPAEWATGTINTDTETWTPSGTETAEETVYIADEYIPAYLSREYDEDSPYAEKEGLSQYLEPRKMMCTYEEWELPDLVYFSFKIGIRMKRLYTLSDVSTDILAKLIYYFRPANMDFNQKINFLDIQEYLLDLSEISPTNDFDYIKGLQTLIIRDVDCNNEIHEVNLVGNYPYYLTSTYHSDTENRLRPIKLGFDQFPVLASTTIQIVEET